MAQCVCVFLRCPVYILTEGTMMRTVATFSDEEWHCDIGAVAALGMKLTCAYKLYLHSQLLGEIKAVIRVVNLNCQEVETWLQDPPMRSDLRVMVTWLSATVCTLPSVLQQFNNWPFYYNIDITETFYTLKECRDGVLWDFITHWKFK